MSAGWTQRPEGGGRRALWLIRTVARIGGRGPARWLLLPITAYFLVVRGPERRASRDYLGRIHGRPARLFEVARHIHAFAATILDRVFLLGGELERFDIRVEGDAALLQQLERGRGVLMFGSHLGSFEVLRVLAVQRPEIPLRVVLDIGHNPALTGLLDALNPGVARTVIDAGQSGPSLLLAIKEATDAGALVALLVDRVQPGQPSRSAPFLGDEARFPVAPWLVASVLQVPVVLGFGLYRGGNRYRLVFELFSEGIAMTRSERPAVLGELVQRYASRLQHHVRSAPYNWFNFYDFWRADDETTDVHPDGAGGRAAGRHVAAGGGD
jgi:predicted LPLAT superfamily acyltransferase